MKLKGELFVLLASAGFAIMAIFAKLAYRGGATVATVLLFRFIFALTLIWGYIFIKKVDFRLKKRQLVMLLALGGVFYSGSSIGVFESYRYISAGLTEVFIFTYPAMVLVIERFFIKDKMKFSQITAIVLSFAGIAVVSCTKGQIFSIKGAVFALAGALFYSLYVAFISSDVFKGIHPVVMTGYLLAAATVAFAVFGIADGGININFKAVSWVFILLLALFSTTIAIFAFMAGAKLIGSSRASIINTIEPVMTFLFGFVFLGEKVTLNMAIGGILIILAVLSIHIFDKMSNIEAKEAV